MISAVGLIPVLVIAAAASAGLILILRPLLARFWLAEPNARSSHRIPTPQWAGIAVITGTILGVLTATVASAITPAALTSLWALAAALAVLVLAGAGADVLHLSIGPRLVLQFIAVGLIVAALPPGTRIVPLVPWGIERAALLVVGVYLVNVVNFMDGLDWMTVAEVAPVTAGFWMLSLFGALEARDAAVAVALLGGIIGFAPFNRPVAKLFLGDVGSLPIGLLLFWLLLQLAATGHLVAALLLPLYYLADASLTLTWRLARGENVLKAHRGHFYQRATERALSVSEVVARVFAVNVALAALAVMTVIAPSGWVQALGLALGAAAVGLLLASFASGGPRGIR